MNTSNKPRTWRAVALVSALLSALLVVMAPQPATAAVINPFTAQYDKAVFGDFVIAGNVATTCPTSAQWSNPNCVVGRNSNSSALGTTYINDAFYMEYVDVDGDSSTFNSSTARITIPAGATVDYARLWWVGNTGDSVRTNGSPYFSCNASQPNSGSPNLATAPTGFANQPFTPSSHAIKLKFGAGTYQSLTPQAGRFYIAPAATNGGRHYAASQDVKSLLAAQPTGVPIDITVGNIWTPKGNNCAGGFAITYVWKFQDPNATYAPQARQVLVFDGFVAQGASDSPTTTTLTGFTLAAGTRRFGSGIIEGDQGIGGDQVLANNVALTEPRISPATTTNYNASTVNGMQNPVYPNSYGLDAKTMEVPASILPNGLTTVPLTFTTSGDQYFPFLFAFSAPVVTNFLSGLVWNDVDGDGVLDPGEAGIAGTTITLTGTDLNGNPVTRTTTTDAGGGYRFDGLLNGTYSVAETQPTAFANSPGTTTNQYVANNRSGFTFSGSVATGITNVNFAEIQSSIAGTVYHDQNADGAKNGAEPGIGGVTVQLTGTDVNGAPVGLTTTTAADGTYKFSNVVPGTYVITEIQPAAYGDGAETAGTSGGTTATNDKIQAINLAGGVNATGYNFGEKLSPLSGKVYVDANNDGLVGAVATEPGIAGVTITVTGTTEAGVPVNTTTTTAADGTWSFPNLLPGTYTVTETQPTALGDGKDTVGTVNATATGSVSNDQMTNVVLTGAGPGVNYNFGELPGTISGRVWYDADKDTVVDGTETFIAGVTITLTKPDGTTATTTTAADGSYSFSGLPAGNYTITETQPTGYGSSTPNSLTPVALPAGGTVTNQNFGETLGTISGKVYVDANSSNNFTAGEPGVPNTTITLKNAAGTVVATTTTDTSGNYTFTGLVAGTYSVVETQPPFMTDAAETAGSAGGNISVNDTISAIVLAAGIDSTGNNFGEKGANISGVVYADIDNDGVIDAGEPGIAGVAIALEARLCVNLLGQSSIPNAGGGCNLGNTIQWVAYDTAVSGADGSYVFLGNDPQLVYRIVETQPANYADGIDTPGTNGSIQANDILQVGTLNYATVLGANGSVNNNFGELAGEVSGYAYVDANNDASRTGDAPIAGVVVTLTSGATTYTTTTDATGFYRFAGLPISAAGVAYTINETQPSTYFDGSESSTGTINPGGVNDRIAVTLTTAARTKAENNFGERLGSISGQVWFDADKDGIKDAGETTGIPTTITITNGAGVVVATGTTNPDGTYSFGGLPPGNYTVTETQPTGYGSSTTNAVAVTLNAVSVTGVDFGETLGSVAGSVYVDTNRNGALDPGEPPISGVTVTLTKPDTTTVTATTDVNGDYVFANLPSGDYSIAETQPVLYNDGSETLGTTGGTLTPTDTFSTVSLDPGEDAVGYLYGELSPSVEGTVYTDSNRNGTQDPGEPGIPGVVVTITGPGGVNLTTTTDISGNYIFPSVPTGPGYTITETQPPGYGSSQQPTNSITALSVPLAGVKDQDFGDTLGTLAGTVYVDGNNNGVQDAGEPGIAGASVTVSGLNAAGQSVAVTVTTAANGDYLVTGLLAGTYSVSEAQPANYDDGKDAAGTVAAGPSGAQDSFATPDRIAGVTLGLTDDGVEYNFGEVGTSIAGTVFRDKDKDGVYDVGSDPALSGVTVELFDSTGTTLLATIVTGADGSYLFPNLAIGTYVVKETQPVGFADTIGAAGPNTRTVVAPGGGIGGIDFGETRGSIAGSVWLDRDADGVRDGTGDPIVPPTDNGIAGVTLTLRDGGGLVVATTTTDANGDYFFDNLTPGTYSVTESQPTAYGDGVDLVGNLGGSAAVNEVLSGIVLGVGAVGTVYDFAEIGANVSGTVWQDDDLDGVIDAAEPTRIGGVSITLDDGNPLTTDPFTTTDANGYYEFTGVPVGNYTIVEVQPAGYASTLPVDDQLPITVAKDAGGIIQSVANQNFGEALGSIGDLVWNDIDGDGIQDPGEPGLPGVTVTGTATIGGTPYTFTTTTDATGAYHLTGLPLGTWTVTVDPTTLPAGMTQTIDADGIATPNASVVTLDMANLSSTVQDFGYQGSGSIGDRVWNDRNGDGVQGFAKPGEPGIPGVKVTLTTTIGGSPVTYTTTTGANGSYSFTGLPLGGYSVVVDPTTLPSGMAPTFDADGVATANASVVTLTTVNPASTVQDFGYRGTGSIGDFVWTDLDGDGIQDPGETGIPGVDVTITTTVAGLPMTYAATTDAFGGYSVAGLPLGLYTVTVDPTTLPAGVTQTYDNDGTATANTSAVTLTSLAPTSDVQDFGYRGAGSIGDRIWNDLDGDGVQDAGEPGIPGVTVTATLTAGVFSVVYTTTTGPDGSYMFGNLPLGDYAVAVDTATLPAGVVQTGDPDATKNNASAVTLTAGSPTSLVQDFGYQGPGTIGDFVWNDLDGDGVQDAGEPGIPGVAVTITTTIAGSPVTYTTTTGPDGSYTVDGLPLGAFTVTVAPATLLGGVLPTFDADGANDNSSSVTLTVGVPDSLTQDFGYRGPGSIGDRIWLDTDGDGTQDAGEPGIPGVNVTITTTIAGSVVTYTATTDATGVYTVSGLPLGAFAVAVNPASLPAGATQTFDADGVGTANTSTTTLTSFVPVVTDQDFGYRGPGIIGDKIWNDLDGDGVQDPGEPGVPGVNVMITTTIAGSPVTMTTTTGPDGSYQFVGLPLAAWTVVVDPATLPAGMTQTGDPDATKDNTSVVTLTAGSPTSLVQDFGYRGVGSIGDFVWIDVDANGVQDVGEPGIAGVAVTITTTIAGSVVTYSATTDAAGHYTVAGLPLGDFTVAVDPASLPAGINQTFDAVGPLDNASAVTLTAVAPTSTLQDFGYQGPGRIGDLIWNDLDGDGFLDSGEPGIPGVTVTATVTIGGSPFTVSTVTGPDGSYVLAGLPLGVFTVTVDSATLPAGMTQTGDPDATKDDTSTVTLTALAPTSDGQDFGYQGDGSIGDLIWNDLNGNGLLDPGEPGLPGVDITITTTIAGSPVTYTTTTDANGGYSLAGLPLGTFTVTVDPASLPVGMSNTGDPDGGLDSTSTVTLTVATPVVTDQDFGYRGPGSIGNFVWNDLNADGVQDAGEPGLPGVDVTITTTIAGSPVTYSTVTDGNGGYSLVGLPVGTFTVAVDPASLPAGMIETFDADGTGTANTSTVMLTVVSPTNDAQDFGYSGTGMIGDLIWNDLDGDGVRDAGEPGIPGITVTVTTTIGGSPVTYTDVTDASGAYLIAGVPLGTYTVTVDPTALPAGMAQTGDPDATKDNTSTVTLTAGAPSSDVQDFGYQGPGTIGDLIWNDLNGDGVRDAGEPGLPGVVVTLTTTVNGTPVVYTATTGPTGAYLVDGLPLGSYIVTVDPATLPLGMSNTGDPDGGNDGTSTVTLAAGSSDSLVQDFGYQGPGTIGDFVWLDLNGDGVQDAGEPGIPGVQVTVTTMVNGSIVLYSAVTDAAGGYLVDGLPLGDFTVTVDTADLPAGLTPSFDGDGTGTPNTSDITLTLIAPDSLGEDFGYRGPGSIGDLIWNDLDGDGVRDAGEPGLPGVTVTATTTVNGLPVTVSTTTGPDGSYVISGLPLGDWTVTVDPATLPGGVVPTFDADGGNDGTSTVTLTAGTPAVTDQDFGYRGPGSIGDLIWNDLNGNGLQDPGEPGLPGVTVTVSTVVAGATLTYTATTDASGAYVIDGLPLGAFAVTVDPASLPGGVLPTFDADGGNDNTSTVVLTAAVPVVTDQDFGYRGPGSIGDFVWLDLDGDGVQDVGEPGIAGVGVTVTTVVAGTTLTYSTTTDAAGGYTIVGLPLGGFTVTVDSASLPGGSVATFDADGGTDDTSDVTLTAGIPAVTDQDFGYRGPGVIGDLIWNDLDGDGVQDPGEPGLPGVTVTVTSTVGGTPVTLTTTTGPDGSYSIVGLPLGDWTVTVDPTTLPPGVANTGDPDGAFDNTTVVTLTAAVPTSDTMDFGYQGVGSIGDLIWNDLNGNGVRDAGEPGLPGVDVTITTTIAGSPVTYTTTTAPDGSYLVDGLPLGTFTVTVDPASLPGGVLPTGDPDGGNDNTATITLDLVTPDNSLQDFGYQGPGSIGDFVWLDTDGDGVQDVGEPGLAGIGVTITTTIGGAPVTYTTTTDAAGGYTIVGLPLGGFTVTVDSASLPGGSVATFDADGGTDDTSDVTLTAGIPAVTDQDFGYRGPGVIGDLIWNDLDGDGVQDPGEPGLPGVTVTVTSTVGGTPVTLTTTTGPDGSYSIVGLPLGDWTVTVDPTTLPPGVANTGDPDGAFDNTTVVTLTAAVPTSDTMDFGYQGVGSIGDFVWTDLNADGVQDVGEPGIAGVTVTITTTIAGSPVTYTTTTDAAGGYLVNGLPLGDFTVTVDPASLPTGIVQTFDSDGTATPNTSAVTLSLAAISSTTQDFGYQGPGAIGDLIWNDLDGDGMLDPGEPGLPGVTVTATTTIGGATFTVTTVTGPDGTYQLAGLPLGDYTVVVDPATLPAGVNQTGDPDATKDNSATVTLTALSPTSTTQDFGYQGPGVIGDLIWNDLNGDGVQDPGEPGLPGVDVTLATTVAGSPVTFTVTTGPDGTYSVSGLPLGDYTVTVDPTTLPLGLANTGDPDGGLDNTAVVTLTAVAPTSDTQDFGYQGPGSIGDFIWNDLNADGVQDAGEPGLPGVDVTITVTIAGSVVTYSATTDATGLYVVSGLPLGDFTVTVDPATVPSAMVQTFDSDGTGTAHSSAVSLTVVAPTSAAEDFGYTGAGVIGDLIWNDQNGNGTQDPGEPGLPGVTVTITTTVNGSPVSYTDVTDPSGAYLIGGLPLGDYTVTVDPAGLPAGLVETGDPDGGNDNTAAVTLTAAAPNSDVQDFGYQGPGVIGDLIWNDLNGDGVRDAGEPGLPGVTVTVTTTIGGSPVTYTTTTGPTGAYQIVGLPLGDYVVTIDPTTLPAGVQPTGDPDGVATPNTASVTLTAAAPTSDVQDFGYQGPGSIGDFIWVDRNGDGVQDAGEPGIPGVQVTITTMINGSIVLYSATTDANGGYLVAGLPLGNFAVTVDAADLPAGVTPTFDSDGTGTPNSSAVTLTVATPVADTEDFGYRGAGVIGDLIWNDLNGDGVQDAGEPGLPGVVVTVTATIGGSPVTVSTTTGPDGTYTISGLPLGAWTVTVDPTSLPAGTTPTGDPDGGNDHTSLVTLTAGAPTSDTQDFGYQGAGSIGDLIWNDLNGDGVQDPGEPGLPGVTVTFTTTIAGSPVTYTTTTGPDGTYLIDGVPLGTFTVTVDPASLPAGVVPTGDPDGGNDNTAVVTLTTVSPTSDTQDFGYRGPGSIGDVVWNDLDGDGVQDPGEPGIPGVVVTIVADIGGSPVTYSATTDALGMYVVDGLPLDGYTVTVDVTSLPGGYVATFDADGVATANTSNATLTAAAPVVDTQDFGYRGPGSIGDVVWNDLDGDGVQDAGEPGIPGVVITISTVIAGIPIDYSVTTGPDGTYLLSGLLEGDYTVTVDPTSLPAGVLPTLDGDDPADGTIGTPHTSQVTIDAVNPVANTQDFGYQGPGSIGDSVWSDTNGDGIQDPGEPGISGVHLTITTVVNGTTVTYPAVTGADGSYSVTGLPLGDFTVTLTATDLPVGSVPTHDGDGTATPNTSAVTLTAAAPTTDAEDFGVQVPTSVGDFVWNDLDGDGIQDAGEPGIAGVAVRLVGQDGMGNAIDLSTTTGGDGRYLFVDVPPGEYTVMMTAPAGYLPTAIGKGADTGLDSNGLTTGITLVSKSVELGIDAGLYVPATLSGLVYFDADASGVFTAGEPGIPGVTVTLTGTTGAGDPITRTATTGSDGRYSFADLLPGTYTVTETQPAAWADGTDTAPPGATVGADAISQIVVVGGTAVDGVQFGELGWPVSGNVAIDGSGTPVPGVTITLRGTDVLGAPVERVVVTQACGGQAATNCVPGEYEFANVPPGTYTVTESQPSGLNQGLTAPTDVVEFVLSGAAVPGLQFTETASSLAGIVFIDTDDDGVFDADESPEADIAVTLTGTDINGNPVSRTVVTDASGRYLFLDLRAGNYVITENQPALLGTGQSVPGTAGGVPGVNTIAVTLGSGTAATGYLFGDVPPRKGTLPKTGADVRRPLDVAVGTVLLGSILLLAGRRRRRRMAAGTGG